MNALNAEPDKPVDETFSLEGLPSEIYIQGWSSVATEEPRVRIFNKNLQLKMTL